MLVVGDANPDLVLRGDVVPRFGQAEQLLDDAALLIGGSAAITAHGFARLGRPVSLLAAVGCDGLAAPMLAELTAAGVRLCVVERATEPTGLTVVLSRVADRAMLTRPGAIPTLTGAEVRQAAAGIPDLGHVHVASLFLQPSLTTELPGVLEDLRAGGVTVSLDTNDDPRGTWRGVAELLPHVDVLLPNESEAVALARTITGRAIGEAAAAARELAGYGVLVAVKRGARGALAVTADGTVRSVDAVPCEPVDTTGAGDTFDAAFLDGWLAGKPLDECLRRGVAAGTAAVTAVGGTAGQPSAGELDRQTRERP
ncbi:carbohydrate kinase family protein [Amycolatopsis pigmentata]|uniref:Carbohydrate kinase family protein n=1 Tax=Amycolatopsis pigmentata TaxID=450801 RepID=A0ABW5FNR0_9PSEU